MTSNKIKPDAFNCFYYLIYLTAGLLTLLCFYLPADARQTSGFFVPESFSNLADSVSPAVVNIRTEKTIKDGGRVFRQFNRNPFGQDDPFQDFFGKFFGDEQQRDHKQRSLGSGFLITKDGYIVTNNHVVEDADKIKVKLKNGNEFDAEIEGRDPKTDLALIKIKSKDPFPHLKFGDSEALQVGQWVVAIGSPFGLEQTVTAGIVSAKGRVIGSGPYDDFIQTDASINPGNSGGPLINMDGEVVGINTAIVAGGHGIGFAIPVNLAKRIIDQLKNHGEVKRGLLGITIQNIDEELAEYYGIKSGKGVLVAEVFPGTPADAAGIKPHDIILSVNGIKVETSRALSSLIASTAIGNVVKIDILRAGKKKTFKVKIGRMDDTIFSSKGTTKASDDKIGVQVIDLTPETANRYQIPETSGVMISNVIKNSKGAKAGLRRGDIIKEINRVPITTAQEYNTIIGKIKKNAPFNMLIKRIHVGFFVIKIVK